MESSDVVLAVVYKNVIRESVFLIDNLYKENICAYYVLFA